MEVYRRSSWLLLLLGLTLLATSLQGVQGEVEPEGPSESECRPYIEKALKELETGEGADVKAPDDEGSSKEDIPTVEITTDDSSHEDGDGDDDDDGKASTESAENDETQQGAERADETESAEEKVADESAEDERETNDDNKVGSEETDHDSQSKEDDHEQTEAEAQTVTDDDDDDDDNKSHSVEEEADAEVDAKSEETQESDEKQTEEDSHEDEEKKDASSETNDGSKEKEVEEESKETEAVGESQEGDDESREKQEEAKSKEEEEEVASKENETGESTEKVDEGAEKDSKESDGVDADEEHIDRKESEEKESVEEEVQKEDMEELAAVDSIEQADQAEESKEDDGKDEKSSKESDNKSDEVHTKSGEDESADKEGEKDADDDKVSKEVAEGDSAGSAETAKDSEGDESAPEEDLSEDIEIPEDLKPRDHIDQLLKLDEDSSKVEAIIDRASAITLRDLKKLYENAIQPLEVLYKYRDLSNRHFGDSEIFSKPLVLFMGPWSGGKSSIINYLVDNEYNDTTLRTGAEPSPAYFNILMHGNEPEVVEGTQLAADFTFSGLQKFGQGLEERLRGLKLPSKLLEKLNLVEIPGILEVRKQVSRVFPFNDACQWFIDRADIIFLVYDPSKLDVGPETEAILDQLKGREYQTRIILNKADQVKPEELMRVQSALIWNISPLMSSAQPPVMYTTSLWSRPYEVGAPTRLLQAQERAFLRDLRTAIDKRIENKIASARRFAVRVRNHAKMVDCYLTTYYNHKSVFGNRKQISDQIIENPQNYHIYEGLSTLTNISRYDLPDPDVYRDFFKLNPLYDFQQLSSTCTYFRGCPINRLDVAIAYDLPELVGKHRRLVETALTEANLSQTPGS